MNLEVALIVFFVSTAVSVNLPPNFKKCNRKQADLKKCVQEAAEDGIAQLVKPFKSLNIPSLNPLDIPEVIIKGSGTVAVDQNFKNCKFYGFDKFKIDQFEFKFDEKTLNIRGIFSEIQMKCDYELDGKVLLLPIRGEGASVITLQNLNVTLVMTYEEIPKDVKNYIKFISSDLDIDPAFMTFNFENLFNGDKQLGDNINKVLNENWKEVFGDVKSNYIELVTQIILGLFNRFFDRVSIEEAFD